MEKTLKDRLEALSNKSDSSETKEAKRSYRSKVAAVIAKGTGKEALYKDDTLSGELDNGGKLLPEEAKDFLRQAVANSPLLQVVRVQQLTRPEMKIPKLAINQFIVKRHIEAEELAEGNRSKVNLSELSIPLIRERVQMDVSLDVLEDNIEGEGLLSTIEAHMFETLGANLDDILLTANTDDEDIRNSNASFAAGEAVKQDRAGLIQKAITGGNVLESAITRAALIDLIKEVQPKYRRRMNGTKGGMMFVMNPDDVLDLKKAFGDRQTALGDQSYLNGLSNFAIEGVPVLEDDNMPAGYVLYTNPKNIVWAASVHDMRVDKVWKPEYGVQKIITRLYYGFDFQEIEGVALLKPAS